jgi:acyl carrier protein
MKETEEKIKNILNEKFVTVPYTITDATNLKNDLGLDSLDTIELIMELETEFNISISDEEAVNLVTMEQIITYINQKIQQ